MKIAVLGYSGAGKSTLARALGECFNVPVLHLDTVQFLPDWEIRNVDESREIVHNFMKNKDWIIDGNYKHFYKAERLEQADKIIILDFNRFFCLKSAVKRYKENKGRTRPDMADGCCEKLDMEFIMWILFLGRRRKQRNEIKNIIKKYPDKIIHFKNRKQVNNFILSCQ